MTAPLEEVVACALCGSRERRRLFSDGAFAVVRCGGCGLGYTTPRLPQGALIEEVYDERYWRSAAPKERGYANYAAEEDLYLRTFRRRMAFVRAFATPPGRLLDVGCAAGYFLTVAGAEGWTCAGVEPSRPIAEVARGRLPGVELHAGLLADAPFAPAAFDLVTLWDVVEHTPDPVAFVRGAVAALRPGGVLILETQNLESPFARLMGRRWQHFKQREHLFHFSPATLRRLLEREAGLALLRMTRRYGGKYVSPAFIAERAGRVHPLLSRLLSPLARLDRSGLYVNLFDELVVACRRPEEAP